MTRQEKIDEIVNQIIASISDNRGAFQWIEDMLVHGRIGLETMTDEELDEEREIWCDSGMDAEIDAMALAHEAATNSE
jgi:hypothetical protein